MNINSLVLMLIIGAAAGWLAGNIMKGKGFGVVGNVVVGIIGAISRRLHISFVGRIGGRFGRLFDNGDYRRGGAFVHSRHTQKSVDRFDCHILVRRSSRSRK